MCLACLLTLRAFIKLFATIIQTQQMCPMPVAYSCSFYCLGYLGLKGLLLSWLWQQQQLPGLNEGIITIVQSAFVLNYIGLGESPGKYVILACSQSFWQANLYLQHPQLQGFSCHPSEFLQSALGPKREAFMDGTMCFICNLRRKLSIVLPWFGV